MITDYQRRKLLYLYKLIDFNKNGFLQLDDFSDIASRICEKREFEDNSRQYKEVSEKCVRFYHRLLKDMALRSQQEITQQEWIDFFDQKIIEEDDDVLLDEYIELLMAYFFGLTDGNNDGYISKEEYKDIFSIFGLISPSPEDSFNNLDVNLDGKLSRYEIKHAIEVFLTSDDPDDLANTIFGSLEQEPQWDVEE